jgi:peptide/nickel transport system substrate-binding protein
VKRQDVPPHYCFQSHRIVEPTPTNVTLSQRLLSALSQLPRRWKHAFFLIAIVFVASTFVILNELNRRFLVEVPDNGGALVEGIIGRPRFINPVLAKSDADRDMTQLVFSGLLRPTPEGALKPDLAESFTVSEDGLVYVFTLRNGLLWHDGEPLTSADVVFTIEKVQDKTLEIKSPRRASWDGVTVKALDERNIEFTLKQPYAPFLENATMGIIPKHIWEIVPNAEFDVSFYNIEPIGSGPYRVKNVLHEDSRGLPVAYELTSFRKYALGEPYITDLTIRFYGNNDELVAAFSDGKIGQIHTVDPSLAQDLEQSGAIVTRTELPRIFAMFFNQSANPALAMKEVRHALSVAVDRDRIVREVLSGYGKTVNGPLPYEVSTTSLRAVVPLSQETRISDALKILTDAGWKADEESGILKKTDTKTKKVTQLSFSVAVSDVEELKQAAMRMKEEWERLGAAVELKVYEPSTFTAEVLTPRAFDALFFGQVIGRIPDLYPYWHSSQRSAPGLNLAQYASRPVDKLLEDLRKTGDAEKRMKIMRDFDAEIARDIPAIFVYSPYFLYVRDKNVRGGRTGTITMESERFLDVTDWYIESDHIWKFLIEHFKRKPQI